MVGSPITPSLPTPTSSHLGVLVHGPPPLLLSGGGLQAQRRDVRPWQEGERRCQQKRRQGPTKSANPGDAAVQVNTGESPSSVSSSAAPDPSPVSVYQVVSSPSSTTTTTVTSDPSLTVISSTSSTTVFLFSWSPSSSTTS